MALTHVCMLSCFIYVWLFVTSWTIACQAPLSMGFSRQEYWSGLSCPSPGDLADAGNQTLASCTADRFFTLWTSREVYAENHPRWCENAAVIPQVWYNLHFWTASWWRWCCWLLDPLGEVGEDCSVGPSPGSLLEMQISSTCKDLYFLFLLDGVLKV